jgi:ABC-type transporter Mla MlaB component
VERTDLDRRGAPAAALSVLPSPRLGDRPKNDSDKGRGKNDSDEELDVRLHAPTPDTVIVWVAGPLHRSTAPLLALRVRQQFGRAAHVILDLSTVTCLDSRAAAHLSALQSEADSFGTHLHIAGSENEAIVGPLRRAELHRPPVTGPADAVLARLATGPLPTVR